MENGGVPMKALIRNKGETVTEDMKVFDIDWGTGAPLTNKAWAGGPYTLVADYVPPEPVEDYQELVEGYDEHGRQQERTRCTAVYVEHENAPEADRLKEIEELKRKLAALESDL